MSKAKPNTQASTFVVRDIPLDKLVPSPQNVRKTYSAASVDELAASLLSHRLLQNLTVRTERDSDGKETGRFEVTAGGRRLSAFKLLAKRKKIGKATPIPCNVRDDGSAVELSLVENVAREALHPADAFVAFRDLQEKEGLPAEDIAARFGVSPKLVRERLKLGAVSPKLLDVYREGQMTLEQVMAFTLTDNHMRQEQLWEGLAHDRSAWRIRRSLLETHVPANDERARFVGLKAYEEAGGTILRDLFENDDGGYLADPTLLDRLATEKLTAAVQPIRDEGWKWVEAMIDFPYDHGLGRVYPKDVPLPADKAQQLEAIERELEELEAQMEMDGDPVLADRYSSLQAQYEALDTEGRVFDPEDIARSGAFVSIGPDGSVKVMRGLLRPEDAEPESEEDGEQADDTVSRPEKANGLSDRLTANLTAHHTLALGHALGEAPDVALLAVTHALALQAFYPMEGTGHSCVEIGLKRQAIDRALPEADGLIATKQIADRHERWAGGMPNAAEDLWGFVAALDLNGKLALLAHCAGLSVWTVQWRSGAERPLAVDQLAIALGFDMRRYWKPTAVSYFRHVSKASIIEAVREGTSQEAATRIADLKKAEMADAAEDLLAETGWLPQILRPAAPKQPNDTPLA